MKIKDFIERLNQEMPGHHKTFPPLEQENFEAWISKKPNNPLPEDFLELLYQSNGIQVWVDKGSPIGSFRLLALHEIDTARQIMWGGTLNDMEADVVPFPHWLALTDDIDGATFIVLDTDNHKYYLMDSSGADLTCPAGNNIQELLDYLWEYWIENLKDVYLE